MSNEKKIILFDGFCNLCNSTIQRIIKHDKNDQFRFAAIQSEVGQKLISERNIDPSSIDSLILIEPGVAFYIKSEAALIIGKHLTRYRILSIILLLISRNLRNIVYDFIAKNRYNWYGKTQQCMVPTPELMEKFLH